MFSMNNLWYCFFIVCRWAEYWITAVMLKNEQLFSHRYLKCWGVSKTYSVFSLLLLPVDWWLRASYFVKSSDTVSIPQCSPRGSWVIFNPLTLCKYKCHDLTFDLWASPANTSNFVPVLFLRQLDFFLICFGILFIKYLNQTQPGCS